MLPTSTGTNLQVPTSTYHSIQQQIEQLVNQDQLFYAKVWGTSIARPRLSLFSLHHIQSVKSMQENLNALGIIATFLAAVQAQIITYSIQANLTRMGIAINAFFFAGLLFDIICACIAVVEAVHFQHIYTLLLRRSTSISAITNALQQHTVPQTDALRHSKAVPDLSLFCLHIQFREVTFLHALSDTRAWDVLGIMESQDKVDEIIRRLDERLHNQVYIHIQEYRGTTQELDQMRSKLAMALSASVMLPVVAFAGVGCLIVGVLCYVKHAQPVGVWVTSFTVAGAILIPFIVMTIHRQFNN